MTNECKIFVSIIFIFTGLGLTIGGFVRYSIGDYSEKSKMEIINRKRCDIQENNIIYINYCYTVKTGNHSCIINHSKNKHNIKDIVVVYHSSKGYNSCTFGERMTKNDVLTIGISGIVILFFFIIIMFSKSSSANSLRTKPLRTIISI